MRTHSAVQCSVPAWQGLDIGERLNAIGDFGVGVGGVENGDTVAVINNGHRAVSPMLQQLGVQVLKVDGKRFLSSNSLPMTSGSVDVVFANMVLHHMRFPGQAIAELERVLNPGGRLVLTDLGKYDDARVKEARNDRWMGFYTSDIRHWFHKAGFSNIIINPVPYQRIGIDIKCMRMGAGEDIFMATGTA